jgi:hypothetical protein
LLARPKSEQAMTHSGRVYARMFTLT